MIVLRDPIRIDCWNLFRQVVYLQKKKGRIKMERIHIVMFNRDENNINKNIFVVSFWLFARLVSLPASLPDRTGFPRWTPRYRYQGFPILSKKLFNLPCSSIATWRTFLSDPIKHWIVLAFSLETFARILHIETSVCLFSHPLLVFPVFPIKRNRRSFLNLKIPSYFFDSFSIFLFEWESRIVWKQFILSPFYIPLLFFFTPFFFFDSSSFL